MDVLRPHLVGVEGRCYRTFDSWMETPRMIGSYVEDSGGCPIEYEDEDDDDIEVVPQGSTRFKHSFHVARPFFSMIIGAKGSTRRRLEQETKTQIMIPSIGHDGDIVIIGYDEKSVRTARRRIDLLVEASRKRLKPTHFLSVPLNDGHLILKFNEFKNSVLGLNARGVDNASFQKPSKLHLTLGMLLLVDDPERKMAIEALDYCRDNIVKPILERQGKITVRLQGVEIMNDEPAETRVLYAVVSNADDGLQEIAVRTMDYFNGLGIGSCWTGRVKLHATLMNVKFKYEQEEIDRKITDTFDATEILKEHKETFFGEITVKQIHVSQRHTISSNGFYQATTKIHLNGD